MFSITPVMIILFNCCFIITKMQLVYGLVLGTLLPLNSKSCNMKVVYSSVFYLLVNFHNGWTSGLVDIDILPLIV
jgi:hypothetical protein